MSFRVNIAGSASTYVLLMIPFAFALSSVIVDISAWNSMRDALQQRADQIALSAAAALPDTEAADRIVSAQSNAIALPDLQASTNYTNSTSDVRGSIIEVTLTAPYRPSFAALFDTKDAEHRFRVSRSATAALLPTDTVLIIADGRTLRPGLNADNTLVEPWGSAGDWPASEAFTCYAAAAPYQDPQLVINWRRDWSSERLRRWATQECFNPVFSAVKASAVSIADAGIASGLSRVSVISTPGPSDRPGFGILRSLTGGPQFGFFKGGAESEVAYYRERQSGLTAESCAVFSMPPISAVPVYEVPGGFTGEPIDLPLCGSPFPFYSEFRSDYTDQSLTLAQSIHWLPAKLPTETSAAVPDLRAALGAALQEFLVTDNSVFRAEADTRKNLAALTQRQVIAIVDTLPGAGELTELLNHFEKQKIDVRIVALQHRGLSESETAELALRTDALLRVAASGRGLRVFKAASPEELELVITPLLVASTKEAVLRR